MAKIIIIDDEPAMVEVIVTLCREKGHQVFPFSSAPKAGENAAGIKPQTVIPHRTRERRTGPGAARLARNVAMAALTPRAERHWGHHT